MPWFDDDTLAELFRHEVFSMLLDLNHPDPPDPIAHAPPIDSLGTT